MDAFERRARHQGVLAGNPEQPGALHHQERPEALAGPQTRIAHGLEQPRRPPDLLARGLGRQQSIEHDFRVFRDLIQAFLEVRNRVHAVLVGASFYSVRMAARRP